MIQTCPRLVRSYCSTSLELGNLSLYMQHSISLSSDKDFELANLERGIHSEVQKSLCVGILSIMRSALAPGQYLTSSGEEG